MYMAEWGEPSTAQRYSELRSVLRELILKNQNKNWDKAITEGRKDLEYVDSLKMSNHT